MPSSAHLSSLNRFVDVEGQSGAVYRFQRIDDLIRLPSLAGNFLIARPSRNNEHIVCCGRALCLSDVEAVWRAILEEHQRAVLFIRLNVNRATRVSEHEDIVAEHEPVRIVTELDLN